MTSARDLIRGAKLRTDVYRVCVHPDLVTEYDEAVRDLTGERLAAQDSFAGGGRAPELQQRVDGLLEAMEAHTLVLQLQALPRREYRALLDAHPPRKDDEGKMLARDERTGVDYDGFYNELARVSIAGVLVDGEVEPLDEESVNTLIDELLTDGQWEELTSRCNRLNRSTVDVPFSPAGSTSRRHS